MPIDYDKMTGESDDSPNNISSNIGLSVTDTMDKTYGAIQQSAVGDFVTDIGNNISKWANNVGDWIASTGFLQPSDGNHGGRSATTGSSSDDEDDGNNTGGGKDASTSSTSDDEDEDTNSTGGGASASGGGVANTGGGAHDIGAGSSASGGGVSNTGGGQDNTSGEKTYGADAAKEKMKNTLDKGVGDTTLYYFDDKQAKEFLDLLTNVSDERRIQPLLYQDNIKYKHRINNNEFNIRIGDCQFIIPPDFISVRTVSQTEKNIAIRQSSSFKRKHGYESTEITIDIYFNNLEQINGFKVESPFEGKYYYVDGLRSLLAQCKVCPLVSVENEFLNIKCDIYTMAIQSIAISTIPGFPKLLKATIIGVDFNSQPYTGLPNYLFDELIEWDLFRYNYQRFLTDISDDIRTNDKLNTIADFSDEMTFFIIDKNSLMSDDQSNIYSITNVEDLKYVKILNSKEDNFVVGKADFGHSNIINVLQLSEHATPTIQYLGGNDSVISLQIETDDPDTVNKFIKMNTQSEDIIREYKEIVGIGFVKIENQFLGLLGSDYLLIDDTTISTVPEFPGKTIISINCVSYDIVSSLRESLNGFRPFKNDTEGAKEDAITQNTTGLINKIKQDCEAERKMGELSLYPDLYLPTYSTINDVISKINAFRASHGIQELGIKKYPTRSSSLIDEGKQRVYAKYLDPDFYMFYPYKYSDINVETKDFKNVKKPKPDAVDKTITYSGSSGTSSDSSDSSTATSSSVKVDNEMLQKYIDSIMSVVGNGYALGSMGEVLTNDNVNKFISSYGANPGITKWIGKRVWDCSGLVMWGMKEAGIVSSLLRLYHMDIYNNYCTHIQKSELKPGDLLFSSGHVATFIGNGKTCEAANTNKGVIIGDSSWNGYTLFGRIKGVESKSASTGNASEDDRKDDLRNYSNGQTSIPIGKFNSIYSGRDYDQYDSLFEKYSKKYGLKPNFMKAVAMTESTMNASVGTNGANARGLMQITPICAQDIGVDYNGLNDAEANINAGCKYFAKLKTFYSNNYDYCDQAYNMGTSFKPGGKVYSETVGHLTKTKKYYQELLNNGGSDDEYTADGGITAGNATSNSSTSSEDVVIVEKKHSNKTDTYSGKLGIPKTYISPANYLAFKETLTDASVNLAANTGFGVTDAIIKKITPTIMTALNSGVSFMTDFMKDYFAATTGLGWAAKYILPDMASITESSSGTDADNALNQSYAQVCDAFTMKSGDGGQDDYPNYMLVDAINYTHKNSLLRAFPTYCLLICDDSIDWLDGRKLWNNYYPYKSVVSIQITGDREQPVTVAKLSVTNNTGNLSKYQDIEIFKKTIADDDEYGFINKQFYKNFGFTIGSPKVTANGIEAKNKIVEEMKLMAGARIHIRLGYGSDPLGLNTRFNGTITEMNVGEVIDIVAQDDGVELINSVLSTSEEEAETNGTFHIGNEPSDILAGLLVSRVSWTNMINENWGEASKYSIEHFGLFGGHNLQLDRQKEYDLCKNIYMGRYDQKLYVSYKDLTRLFDEKPTKMFLYNKTPWDCSQVVTQTLPDFICRPMYHQFESRLYFGLPYWLCKYRYDIDENNVITEQAKSFSQYHMIDFNDILENKIKCVNKRLYTNCIGMYTISGDMKATPTIFSDKNIDWSKQKTKLVDTTLVQDNLFWDKLWSFLGYKAGKWMATNVCTSALIDSFGKMYTGEIYSIGNPAIKPCDYVYLNDKFAQVTGTFQVRRIVDTFSSDTGYITATTPDLMAYSKVKDAANSNVYRTFESFMTVAMTASLVRVVSIYALKNVNMIIGLAKIAKSSETMKEIRDIIKTAKIVTKAGDTIKNIETIAKASEAIKKTANIVKLTKGAKTLGTVINSVKVGATTASNEVVPIVGPIVTWIITTIIFDHILESVIDFFSYDNCIGIRPLYYKNKPLVTGIKGSKDLIDGWSDTSFDITSGEEE